MLTPLIIIGITDDGKYGYELLPALFSADSRVPPKVLHKVTLLLERLVKGFRKALGEQ